MKSADIYRMPLWNQVFDMNLQVLVKNSQEPAETLNNLHKNSQEPT